MQTCLTSHPGSRLTWCTGAWGGAEMQAAFKEAMALPTFPMLLVAGHPSYLLLTSSALLIFSVSHQTLTDLYNTIGKLTSGFEEPRLTET